MALALTILSILLCYFTPDEIVPALAPYHLQQVLLIPAMLISLVMMSARGWKFQMPQQLLLLGFWFAIGMSFMSKARPLAALRSVTIVALVIGVYFLVYLNTSSVRRVRIIAGFMIFCALFLSLEGIWAYHFGGDIDRPNILIMRDPFLGVFKRIRAYGTLNDPNDFAQFLIVCQGLALLFWRGFSPITKFLFVLLPITIMGYAIFLTSSRGAMFGLVALVAVLLSRQFGRFGSLVGVFAFFVIMVVLQFGGGRDLTLSEGSASGRILAWGVGIAELRQSPVFGVGWGQFTRVYYTQTAHNSWVLCFAELGFFGYFFWLGLLVTTCWGLEQLAKVRPKTQQEDEFLWQVTAIRAALYGFLATSWFLSRTYDETLYIVLALAAVMLQLAPSTLANFKFRRVKWVPMTVVLEFASVLVVYATIRVRTF